MIAESPVAVAAPVGRGRLVALIGCVACQNVPVTPIAGAVPMLTVGAAANAGSVPVIAVGTGFVAATCAPCTYRFAQGTSTDPLADATLQRLCKLPLPSLTVMAPCDWAKAGTLAEMVSAIVNVFRALRIVVTYIALSKALFEGSEKSN